MDNESNHKSIHDSGLLIAWINLLLHIGCYCYFLHKGKDIIVTYRHIGSNRHRSGAEKGREEERMRRRGDERMRGREEERKREERRIGE